MSNYENISKTVSESDLVIGGVLVAGAKAPMLITREMIKQMSPGSVVVDVAIDQGGCIETIRPTTHDNPVYLEEGVLHYGVTNIPGDVPLTSTYALTNVTLPYAVQIANKGMAALKDSEALRRGLNTHEGMITYKAVAEAHGLPYHEYRV
jgi:alanine dehydrogenase